jgi:hypothetical protein
VNGILSRPTETICAFLCDKTYALLMRKNASPFRVVHSLDFLIQVFSRSRSQGRKLPCGPFSDSSLVSIATPQTLQEI